MADHDPPEVEDERHVVSFEGDGATASRCVIHVHLPKDKDARDKPSSPWERFLVTPLGAAMITLLFTTVLGGAIANHYAEQQRLQTDYLGRIENSEKNRAALLASFAQTLEQRKSAAALVWRAIADNAPTKELSVRWNQYQQSYIAFHLNIPTFRTNLLETLGAKSALPYFSAVDYSITRSLARIDDCITSAYRLQQHGRATGARSVLKACTERPPIGGTFVTAAGKPFVVGAAKSWEIAAESDRLQGCYTTVETQLMYSIYIENRFDSLDDDDRTPRSVKLIRGSKVIISLPVAVVDSVTMPAAKCAIGTDWVCQRLLGRAKAASELTKGCSPLTDDHYFEPARPPARNSVLPMNVTVEGGNA